MCDERLETIDHLISGCSVLAPTEYLKRHDRLGKFIHWTICKYYSLPHHANWWEHEPAKVTENEAISILWDFSIHTDRTIQANRPDIVVKNHENKTCILIDMAVPSDSNVSSKVFEKLSKYKDLEIEVTKLWHLKTVTLPVVIGALGMISKNAPMYISQIPGSPSLAELQKIALMGTSHILRKTLSM